MDGGSAPGPLFLPSTERLQAGLERPPVLAAEVFLQLSGEGGLVLIAQTISDRR